MKKENADALVEKMPEKKSNLTYQVVRGKILEMMKSGRMMKGDRLPTEKELAEKFEVNHQTLRRAIAPLVEAGYLRKQVGAGTFLNVDAAEISFPDIGMSMQKSTVAVFSPLQHGSHLNELMHHLVPLAEARGISIAHYPLSMNSKHLAAILNGASAKSFAAAMLFLSEDFLLSQEMIRLLYQTEVPFVTSRPIEGLDEHSRVSPQVYGGADVLTVKLACDHFLSLGYQHIIYLGPDANSATFNRRVLAFNRIMSNSEVFSKVRFVGNSQDMDEYVEYLKPFAGNVATICFDDDLAIRLMMSLHKKRLRIPEDAAVLGANDIPVAVQTDPPLSTISFDYDYVAGTMLDHAMAMAKGESAQVTSRGAKMQLIIRESCGAKLNRPGISSPMKELS
jgi:DNA-binding LacI/PurR family transcriptional regulator